MLKTIAEPPFDHFEELIQEVAVWARKAGLKLSSIESAINKARRKVK